MEKIEYSLTKDGIGQRTTSEVDGVVVFSSKTDNFDENAIISEDQAKAHFAELQAASDRVDEKVAADAASVAAEKAKQAQEAYDAALGAGLPEIVALGIARGIYLPFEPKTNNGNGTVK